MTTLKELTAEKHREAEMQPFLKTIFAGEVNHEKYTHYLFQLLNIQVNTTIKVIFFIAVSNP